MAATLDIDTLTVVRSESAALIRDEVRALNQRERLERAVTEAVTKLGVSIDDVSDASGLTPAEIRRLLARTDASA
jgi:DNA-directed RNA polymerase specialized sigma24 family protein